MADPNNKTLNLVKSVFDNIQASGSDVSGLPLYVAVMKRVSDPTSKDPGLDKALAYIEKTQEASEADPSLKSEKKAEILVKKVLSESKTYTENTKEVKRETPEQIAQRAQDNVNKAFDLASTSGSKAVNSFLKSLDPMDREKVNEILSQRGPNKTTLKESLMALAAPVDKKVTASQAAEKEAQKAAKAAEKEAARAAKEEAKKTSSSTTRRRAIAPVGNQSEQELEKSGQVDEASGSYLSRAEESYQKSVDAQQKYLDALRSGTAKKKDIEQLRKDYLSTQAKHNSEFPDMKVEKLDTSEFATPDPVKSSRPTLPSEQRTKKSESFYDNRIGVLETQNSKKEAEKDPINKQLEKSRAELEELEEIGTEGSFDPLKKGRTSKVSQSSLDLLEKKIADLEYKITEIDNEKYKINREITYNRLRKEIDNPTIKGNKELQEIINEAEPVLSHIYHLEKEVTKIPATDVKKMLEARAQLSNQVRDLLKELNPVLKKARNVFYPEPTQEKVKEKLTKKDSTKKSTPAQEPVKKEAPKSESEIPAMAAPENAPVGNISTSGQHPRFASKSGVPFPQERLEKFIDLTIKGNIANSIQYYEDAIDNYLKKHPSERSPEFIKARENFISISDELKKEALDIFLGDYSQQEYDAILDYVTKVAGESPAIQKALNEYANNSPRRSYYAALLKDQQTAQQKEQQQKNQSGEALKKATETPSQKAEEQASSKQTQAKAGGAKEKSAPVAKAEGAAKPADGAKQQSAPAKEAEASKAAASTPAASKPAEASKPAAPASSAAKPAAAEAKSSTPASTPPAAKATEQASTTTPAAEGTKKIALPPAAAEKAPSGKSMFLPGIQGEMGKEAFNQFISKLESGAMDLGEIRILANVPWETLGNPGATEKFREALETYRKKNPTSREMSQSDFYEQINRQILPREVARAVASRTRVGGKTPLDYILSEAGQAINSGTLGPSVVPAPEATQTDLLRNRSLSSERRVDPRDTPEDQNEYLQGRRRQALEQRDVRQSQDILSEEQKMWEGLTLSRESLLAPSPEQNLGEFRSKLIRAKLPPTSPQSLTPEEMQEIVTLATNPDALTRFAVTLGVRPTGTSQDISTHPELRKEIVTAVRDHYERAVREGVANEQTGNTLGDYFRNYSTIHQNYQDPRAQAEQDIREVAGMFGVGGPSRTSMQMTPTASGLQQKTGNVSVEPVAGVPNVSGLSRIPLERTPSPQESARMASAEAAGVNTQGEPKISLPEGVENTKLVQSIANVLKPGLEEQGLQEAEQAQLAKAEEIRASRIKGSKLLEKMPSELGEFLIRREVFPEPKLKPGQYSTPPSGPGESIRNKLGELRRIVSGEPIPNIQNLEPHWVPQTRSQKITQSPRLNSAMGFGLTNMAIPYAFKGFENLVTGRDTTEGMENVPIKELLRDTAIGMAGAAKFGVGPTARVMANYYGGQQAAENELWLENYLNNEGGRDPLTQNALFKYLLRPLVGIGSGGGYVNPKIWGGVSAGLSELAPGPMKYLIGGAAGLSALSNPFVERSAAGGAYRLGPDRTPLGGIDEKSLGDFYKFLPSDLMSRQNIDSANPESYKNALKDTFRIMTSPGGADGGFGLDPAIASGHLRNYLTSQHRDPMMMTEIYNPEFIDLNNQKNVIPNSITSSYPSWRIK